MKKQVYNPYLPLYEYIPDGEPHVFEGRVYVYGSHDQFGAFQVCHNNYVTWSAPLDDLSDWRYEGEILDKKADPENKNGKRDLYAPDACQGPDGKYYIYYAYDWLGHIGVGVADKPSGPFAFHGHVKHADGVTLGDKKGDAFQFDPGVLVDEDGRVYLYSGFGPNHWFPQIKWGKKADGGYVMELEPDMLTIKDGPTKIFEPQGKATDGSIGHEFFEASSIRKINGRYYFVYSTIGGHELAYYTGDSPKGPFTYGGVIVSNGDVGFNGRDAKNACYPLGNNHGGIVQVGDKFYIFYHRHTNFTNTDRQGMAEEIKILEDGSIPQVEMTSCGLNGGPLKGQGTYPASICCCLIPKEGNVFYPFFRLPHQNGKLRISQSGTDDQKEETQYVKNVQDGSLIGYKYFDLSNAQAVTLSVEGKAEGTLFVRYEEQGESKTKQAVSLKGKGEIEIALPKGSEKQALYFYYQGKGRFDFFSFTLK